MSKQRRLYFRRSLCGILSAAMIMTGLLVPDATAYAAQPDLAENAAETVMENEDSGSPGSEDAGKDEGDKENSEENRGGGNSDDTGSLEGDLKEPTDPDEGEGENDPVVPGEGDEEEVPADPGEEEEPVEDEDSVPDEMPDDVTEGEDNEEIEEAENTQQLFSVERAAYGELQNGGLLRGRNGRWRMGTPSVEGLWR